MLHGRGNVMNIQPGTTFFDTGIDRGLSEHPALAILSE